MTSHHQPSPSGAYEFELRTAERYDEGIRKSIPGYELIHEISTVELDRIATPMARVLCVGSGTGQELVELAKKQPTWKLTGVDKSEAMNSIAQQRLDTAGMRDRVDLHTGELVSLPASEAFDAGTAIFVMHFIPDDGAKLAFLSSIAARLKPGAIYMHCDIHGEAGSAAFQRQLDAWRRFQLARGTAPDEVDEFFRLRFPKTHPVTAKRTVSLMREAGFAVDSKPLDVMVFGAWICMKI